jgi:invasion protein IalB
MAGKIFINYRRDDSISTAGRLHDRLAQAFGRKNLFMDVDHIPAGVDFVEYLNGQVAACDIFLAIIGPNWLNAKDEYGRRRVDNPDDFVSVEIAAALARNSIRVIPVLVDGAHTPKADKLPDSIKPLVRRNAVEVRNTHFGRDAEALVEKVREALRGGRPIAIQLPFLASAIAWLMARRRWCAVAGSATALLVGFIALYQMGVPVWVLWTPRGEQSADAGAQRKAVEVEQQRLKEEVQRQTKAAADAEAKRKAAEAEQLAAVRAEEERKAKTAAEAEARARAQDASTSLTFSSWSKSCASTSGRQTCTMSKEGRDESGSIVVAAELEYGERNTLRVTLPLGMSLRPGTRVIVDNGQPLTAPYTDCFVDGCVAEYKVSGELLAQLKNGHGLTVQGIKGSGQPISLLLPLSDFAKALSGPAMGETTRQNERKPAFSLSGQQLFFSPWTKFCLMGQEQDAKQACFIGMDARDELGMPVGAAVVIEPENQPKRMFRVTFPLGTSLQSGTRLMVDNGPPMTAPYVICFNNGCMADYEGTGELITQLKKGRNVFIRGTSTTGQPVTVALPLAEFAKAFDGPPTDPKQLEAQQKRLQEELQRRAEEARRRLR